VATKKFGKSGKRKYCKFFLMEFLLDCTFPLKYKRQFLGELYV
jgi:hypothetical protein